MMRGTELTPFLGLPLLPGFLPLDPDRLSKDGRALTFVRKTLALPPGSIVTVTFSLSSRSLGGFIF